VTNTTGAATAANQTGVQFTPAGDTAIQRVAGKGRVLYDSGTACNSGGACDSGVLDLTGISSLEVTVDNTASTTWRNLSMTSYLDDGTTTIDSVVLRRVGWGSASNGAENDPGRARVQLSSLPSSHATGERLLYDVTSATNTALDTGALLTEDCDFLSITYYASAGTATFVTYEVDDAGTSLPGGGWGMTAAAQNYQFVGPGTAVGIYTTNASVRSHSVPRRMRFTTGAAGTGNTVRLRVFCRGRVPGSSTFQMTLPTKAKFSLGAGGSANGRLTVIGR
jgi:hypothetical protein